MHANINQALKKVTSVTLVHPITIVYYREGTVFSEVLRSISYYNPGECMGLPYDRVRRTGRAILYISASNIFSQNIACLLLQFDMNIL